MGRQQPHGPSQLTRQSHSHSLASRASTMAQEGAPAIQLIDDKGAFHEDALVEFCKAVRLSECGLSYAVVAIMGPQSSGKSTLLNHLFGTQFKEMDALMGRNQTTKGVWMQRAEGIDPCTLVMDLEGTDGRERGEDDTAFEKQSALFSLAVADIVLINMWCHDIGREQASNKPLLKTVFQVMMRLFSPRKTTMMFVIRDKTKTPMEVLEPILREDVRKIWDEVQKPGKHKDTPLTEFFNVEVTALSNYEEKEERFEEEIGELKERFQNSVAPGGLAGDRRAVVPGSGFPFSAHEMWKVIKENKDLDLPAHKVMVATVRCEEIAHEKLQALGKDEKWKKIDEASREGAVPGFGKSVSAILDRYVSEYDAEAGFFDEGVRVAKRNYLISEALEIIQPAYDSVVSSHRTNALEKFKADLQGAGESEDQEFAAVVRRCAETALASFDRACADASVAQAASAWDPSKAREKLVRDTNAHAQSLRSQRLQQLKSNWQKRLEGAIAEPVLALLDSAPEDAWSSIRELVESETQKVTAGLAAALAGFEPTREEESAILTDVAKYSRTIVEKKAREETNQALIRMKDRFNNIFGHDEDSMPRVWGEDHDVRKITKTARVVALKMLAVIAALRLDPKVEEDGVEDALLTLVSDADDDGSTRDGSTTSNPLASSTWTGIAPEDTLLTPAQCRSLWRQFRAETEYTISQALSAQEAKRHGNNWLPPPWAIAAMLVLGFNELMTVLRNPIYLPIVFVAFLLAKAVWVQLDLQRHFQYGALPGLVSISTRFLPTVMETFNNLVAAGTVKPAEAAASSNFSRRSSQTKLSDDDDD